MRPALTGIFGNVVLGSGPADAWAVYEILPEPYAYASTSRKLELLARVEALLYRVGADAQLLRVARPVSAEEYLREARCTVDERHCKRALLDHQLACDADLLESRQGSAVQVFLAVSLADGSGDSGLASLPGRRIDQVAGLLRRPFPTVLRERDAARLRSAEARALARVERYLRCDRVGAGQLQWLVRRVFTRGVGEPVLDLHDDPAVVVLGDELPDWRPDQVEVRRWSDALIEHDVRSLRVHTEEGVSHQAQLILGALPGEAVFPGEAELLFWPLERVGFPVDVALHLSWVPNRAAVALARRRRADAETFFEEEALGHGLPSSEASERPHAARELEHRLTRPDRPPLLRAMAVLSVGARSEAELEQRVERLRVEYGSVALHRPAGEQHRLLLSTFPGQRIPLGDYSDHWLCEQAAALMAVAVDQAGSETGLHLGRTLSAAKRPVRLDLTEASRRSRPPTVLLLGTLGSGKTIAMQALAYRAWLAGSGPVVDIDPKGDHHWERLPGVVSDGPDANLETIELSGDGDHRGLLDPLRIAEAGEREDLAYGFLAAILPQPVPAPWQTELRDAVARAVADGATCSGRIVEILESGEGAAAECGRALSIHARAGIAQLAFADPAHPPPTVGEREIVCLRLRGLRLPAADRAPGDYEEGERIGVALLRLLAAFALHLAATDPDRHSVVCIDEAWALLASSPETVARLARLGRSQNVTPLLATQRIDDVAALDGLVGTSLIFGLDSDAQARAALELVRQDPDDETLRRRLLAFRRGQCLLLDLDGRLTAMQVEITDPRVLEALDTTPRAEPAAARA